MIDPATGWFDIAEISTTQADQVANVLEQTWFSTNPWPQKVIHDRGTEFMAEVHEMLTQDHGYNVNRTTTTCNPQVNASIVEHAAQTKWKHELSMVCEQSYSAEKDLHRDCLQRVRLQYKQ